MNQFIRFPIQIITSGIIEFMGKSHLRVYMCLDFYKNRKHQSFPSLETIRKKIKMDREIIQKAIKDMIEWGLIKKAHVRREKGKGYRTIYTLPQEPLIKIPHKKIREKILNSAKQKRDSKGRFLDVKQRSQRTVLNGLKQRSHTATLKKDNLKQRSFTAATNKRSFTANPKPVNSANNQSSLTSNEPVKKESLKKESLQPKPFGERKTKKPVDTSESAFTQHLAKLFPKKNKPKKERTP